LLRALDKLFFSTSSAHRGLEPPRPATDREEEHLERLGRAVVAQRKVRIVYRSYRGERTERTIAPYGLTFRSGAWFLVAHCELRQAVRTFLVERIATVEEVAGKGAAFTVPAGFDVGAHVGRQAWELALHPKR